MAYTAGTSLRLQRLSALAAISLVAIAVGFAFGRILIGHGATYRMIVVGIASGALAWATERRGMLVATLISAAALLLVVTWLSVPHSTWYALPTLESVRSLGTLATMVGAQAREYVSPAPATPALVMAGAIAVWAAVFSCYALAFRAQSPLLALVPPLTLVVFADGVLDDQFKPVYGVMFLVAALGVLFADSLRRIRAWGPVWSPVAGRDRLLPVAASNARRVGATALVVAALAPLFVPGFGSTSVLDISHFGSDNRLHVSPLVQISAVLQNTQDNQPFFEVQVDPGHPSYWPMVTLDTFDGNTWEQRDDPGTVVQNDAIQSTTVPGQTVTQTFTMEHDLGYSWLVAGGIPTQISIDHTVTWHPLSSSLTMDGWPNKGESYTVTSTYASPTPDQLRAQGLGQDPYDLQLPPIPPVIEQKAQRWTAGATSPYDEVLAIMQHLRNTGNFVYDPTVKFGEGSQGLVEFLDQRRGFCQQFASLMAVMLRSLKIPAVVEFGFTQGQPVAGSPDTYIVHGQDLHSWVEVPFNGYGWLTFDPTPSFIGDPSSLSYIRVSTTTDTCRPTEGRDCVTHHHHHRHNENGGAARGHIHEEGRGAAATRVGPSSGSRLGLGGITLSGVVVAGIAVAVMLAMGIPFLHWMRRRRRLHAANDPRTIIIATYDVFADRARELGVDRAPGDTLDEFRDRLVATDRLRDADRPLVRMTTEVVRAAYSAEPPDAATAQGVSRDADAVLHALRSTTSLRQRVLGRYRNERGTNRRTRRIAGR